MENEIIKASEFGVEEKQAKELTTGLNVILAEREVLIKSYKSVIASEITEDNLDVYKELRLKIVKNRTQGINKWHTASKAYFLAGGKFCDAIKNKETLVNTDMEAKLQDAENHFENIEKERIQNLHTERFELCKPHVEDESFILPDLGCMSEQMWDMHILGLKTSSDARKAAALELEKQRIEKEWIEKLNDERNVLLRPYHSFIPVNHPNFGTLSNDEWEDFFTEMQNTKKAHDKKQKETEAENLRLKKEAKAKEQKLELERLERERLAKIEADKKERIQLELKLRNDKRNDELRPYIVFIRDYSTLLDSEEKEYQKQFTDIKKGAQLQWESDKKEAQEKAAKEEKERIERERLASELQKKEDADTAEKVRLQGIENSKKEAEKLAKLAPEKDKITIWIDSFSINEIDSIEFSESGKAAVNVIKQKFEAFKKWADSQKETIK